jgi:hypothetical protein
MNTQSQKSHYLSYLLRLWQVDAGGSSEFTEGKIWRVSIESSLTGERLGFADLGEFIVFLLKLTGSTNRVDEQGS